MYVVCPQSYFYVIRILSLLTIQFIIQFTIIFKLIKHIKLQTNQTILLVFILYLHIYSQIKSSKYLHLFCISNLFPPNSRNKLHKMFQLSQIIIIQEPSDYDSLEVMFGCFKTFIEANICVLRILKAFAIHKQFKVICHISSADINSDLTII